MDRSIAQLIVEAAAILADVADVADRDTVDLKREYKALNQKLWGGSLPIIPLKWMRSKRFGGLVRTKGLRDYPDTWEIQRLEVSDFTESTFDELLGILVHEMVHVYIISNGILDRGEHGPLFKKELARVAKLVSYPVPVTEDISKKKVSKKVKVKTVGVVIIRGRGIQIYMAKAMPAVIEMMTGFPEDWKKLYDIEFFLSADHELAKYPTKRAPKRGQFKFYPVGDEFEEKIRQEGKSLGVLS